MQYQQWIIKQSEKIHQEANERDGDCIWLPTVRLMDNSGTQNGLQLDFSIARMMRNPINGNQIGYIVQGVDDSFFETTFKDMLIGSTQQFMITDTDGTIIWDSNTKYISKNVSKTPFLNIDFNKDISISQIGGESYQISTVFSNYNGWRYTVLMPTKVLYKNIQPVKTFSDMIWIISPLVLIFGLLFDYLLITIPLKMLIVDMNSFVPDNKLKTPNKRISNDEIGVLYKSFFSMQKRINLLLKQVVSANNQQIQQELMTLQAQLNPHFLYNTLDTVNWLANDIGADSISKIIKSLAQILRYSIGKKGNIVTVGDEINMVKNYMYIQEFRFQNKFHMDIEVDEDVLTYPIDKLIIQPIVENAINHGLSECKQNGVINLKIIKEQSNILISVYDNGIGMTQEKISDILVGKTNGIGLYNINKFLQIKYGPEYGIKISSTPGIGTTVTLKISTIPIDL
jgi:sensor histidine kinase YesM